MKRYCKCLHTFCKHLQQSVLDGDKIACTKFFHSACRGYLRTRAFSIETQAESLKKTSEQKRRHQNDRSPHETTHAIRRLPHRQSPTVPHKHLSQRSQTGQAFSARQTSWNHSIKTMAHRINAQCPVQTKSTHRLARA